MTETEDRIDELQAWFSYNTGGVWLNADDGRIDFGDSFCVDNGRVAIKLIELLQLYVKTLSEEKDP